MGRCPARRQLRSNRLQATFVSDSGQKWPEVSMVNKSAPTNGKVSACKCTKCSWCLNALSLYIICTCIYDIYIIYIYLSLSLSFGDPDIWKKRSDQVKQLLNVSRDHCAGISVKLEVSKGVKCFKAGCSEPGSLISAVPRDHICSSIPTKSCSSSKRECGNPDALQVKLIVSKESVQ
jgi:hypothetical protein